MLRDYALSLREQAQQSPRWGQLKMLDTTTDSVTHHDSNIKPQFLAQTDMDIWNITFMGGHFLDSSSQRNILVWLESQLDSWKTTAPGQTVKTTLNAPQITILRAYIKRKIFTMKEEV